MTPPPELRERLLTAVASTPQERPVVTALSQRSRVRRMAPRVALAAAVAAAVIGIGGFVAENERADDLRADRARLSAVMSAPDAATTEESRGRWWRGPGDRLADARRRGRASVRRCRRWTPTRRTRCGGCDDGKPTSVGLLGRGPGMLYVDGIKGADAFAVTVEPSGGSPQPTSDPIVATPV